MKMKLKPEIQDINSTNLINILFWVAAIRGIVRGKITVIMFAFFVYFKSICCKTGAFYL